MTADRRYRPDGVGHALAVMAAMTAIAVTATKIVSTGVATSSAQRRIGALPVDGDYEPAAGGVARASR